MFAGTTSVLALCHPAWSMITIAWSPEPSSLLMIFRNTFIMPVFACGACSATLAPVAGSTAADMYTYSYRGCFNAVGREPRGAHTRVSVPCWPKRASSMKKTRIRTLQPPAGSRRTFTERDALLLELLLSRGVLLLVAWTRGQARVVHAFQCATDAAEPDVHAQLFLGDARDVLAPQRADAFALAWSGVDACL